MGVLIPNCPHSLNNFLNLSSFKTLSLDNERKSSKTRGSSFWRQKSCKALIFFVQFCTFKGSFLHNFMPYCFQIAIARWVCIIASMSNATFVADSLGNDELLSNKKSHQQKLAHTQLKCSRISFSPVRLVLLTFAESFPIFSTISETHLMRIRWSWLVTPLLLFCGTKITWRK